MQSSRWKSVRVTGSSLSGVPVPKARAYGRDPSTCRCRERLPSTACLVRPTLLQVCSPPLARRARGGLLRRRRRRGRYEAVGSSYGPPGAERRGLQAGHALLPAPEREVRPHAGHRRRRGREEALLIASTAPAVRRPTGSGRSGAGGASPDSHWSRLPHGGRRGASCAGPTPRLGQLRAHASALALLDRPRPDRDRRVLGRGDVRALPRALERRPLSRDRRAVPGRRRRRRAAGKAAHLRLSRGERRDPAHLADERPDRAGPSRSYAVTYRRFQGGHEVPEAVSRAAVRWVVGR